MHKTGESLIRVPVPWLPAQENVSSWILYSKKYRSYRQNIGNFGKLMKFPVNLHKFYIPRKNGNLASFQLLVNYLTSSRVFYFFSQGWRLVPITSTRIEPKTTYFSPNGLKRCRKFKFWGQSVVRLRLTYTIHKSRMTDHRVEFRIVGLFFAPTFRRQSLRHWPRNISAPSISFFVTLWN